MKHQYHSSFFRAISLLILLMAQANMAKTQVIRDFLPIEKALLETILLDTVSETYCQLPHGLKFGIFEEPRVNMILLKSRSKNILLRNAGPQMYSVRSSPSGPYIERIDQDKHQGDNFAKIAFIRKDTILEVGGYGFWKVRDHFSYFDPTTKKWHPKKGTDRLPFERFYHYFDPKSDQFYLFGQIQTENKKSTTGRTFSDSMFRFSFESGKWETLGKIEPDHWAMLNDPADKYSNTFHTPFGLGGNISGTLSLRDPANNNWFAAQEHAYVAMRAYIHKIDSVSHNYRVFIHLNDSLHLFLGDTKTFIHGKIRLTRSNFETKPSGSIYIPIEKKSRVFSEKSIWIGMLSSGSIFSILLLIWVRKKRETNMKEVFSPNDQLATEVGNSMPTNDNIIIPEEQSDMNTFLASLTSGEKSLVEKLYIATLQGKQMDIDSINKILGVGRKEVSVQKTRRSTAISKINESFAISLKLKNPLIVRHRDDDDKRSYTYQLADEHLERIRKYLA